MNHVRLTKDLGFLRCQLTIFFRQKFLVFTLDLVNHSRLLLAVFITLFL